MSGMVKLGLTLAVYAATACTSLAVVYSVTAPAIAAHKEAELRAALKAVFPEADDYSALNGDLSPANPRVRFLDAFLMKRSGAVMGVAVKASGPSYSGDVVVLSGVGTDRRISKVMILEIKDTPGLGANAANPSYFVDRAQRKTFTGQFSGKNVSDRFEVKDDVVSITASTITSRAVAILIKEAGDAAVAYFQKTGVAQ